MHVGDSIRLAISGIAAMRPLAPASLRRPGTESTFLCHGFLMSSSGMLYILDASLMISLMYNGTFIGWHCAAAASDCRAGRR